MEDIDTSSIERFLAPYLPATGADQGLAVTLTWAQSLDGRIAAAPGERTRLSGLYSKKMTHYLRSKHDAILVGCSTVLADNPRLNCRYAPGSPSPVPVILDPLLKWDFSSGWEQWAVLAQASRGETKGPWVVVNQDTAVPRDYAQVVEQCRGRIVRVRSTHDWAEVYAKLHELGVKSLMVEGGAKVIDSYLQHGHIGSVIVTIAPVFLGRNGVDAAPGVPLELRNVRWAEAESDSVMAATYY